MNNKKISLVLGILALILWLFPWIGLVLSVIGIVFAIFEIKNKRSRIIILAIILNIAGLILSVYNFTYRIEKDRLEAEKALFADVFLDNLDKYIIDFKYYDANVVDSIAEIEDSIQKAKIVLSDITAQGAAEEDRDRVARTVAALEGYKDSVTKIGLYVEDKIKEFEDYRNQYLTGLMSPEEINAKVATFEADLLLVNKDYLIKNKELMELQKSFEERYGQ